MAAYGPYDMKVRWATERGLRRVPYFYQHLLNSHDRIFAPLQDLQISDMYLWSLPHYHYRGTSLFPIAPQSAAAKAATQGGTPLTAKVLETISAAAQPAEVQVVC
jgi:hypothetical protein